MSATPSSTAQPSFTCTTTSIPELTPFIRPDMVQALSTLLSDNHAAHHCFFNTRGLHNHSIHQLIADLTLSATPAQLRSHYEYQIKHYLGEFSLSDRAKYDPYVASNAEADRGRRIDKITEHNWKEHVGNARYYWSYLHFFDAQVSKLGFQAALEKYVFSREANQGTVQMLVRFYGGVLHALIHYGYALELQLEGIAGEALAMATSTSAAHTWLFDYGWLFSDPSSSQGDKKGLLHLVAEIQKDDRLGVQALRLKEQDSALPDQPFESGSGTGVIQEYVDRWSGDQEQAVGELAVLSALLLGSVPKQADGVAYKHDFFLMHLNNAHLFTPLLLSHLPPTLHRGFLRALISQFFYYYIARGRPVLTPSNFAQQPTALDWNDMFHTARDSVDEHLPKAVRALYVFEQRHQALQPQLVESGLFDERWQSEGGSVWRRTADQLVRMHRGELQQTKHEQLGAHQEFWSFDPWF